jgi:hypothetical protein
MKVTVKRVTKKDIETSKGPAVKWGIQTEEHGDKWLGAFENKYNKEDLEKMKEGSTANIVVTQSGDFLNFRTMNKTDLLEERVSVLESLVLSKGSTAPVAETTPTPAASDDDNW